MIGNDPSVKGGITSVINQLLDYDWEKENIEMNFVPTYVEGNSIKKLFIFLKGYVKILKQLSKKETRPDVVHIHMSYRGSFIRKFAVHKICLKYDVPDIIHLHGSEFKKWYDSVSDRKKIKIRQLLKESKAFIVLGEKWNKIIKDIEMETNTVIVSNTVHIPEDKVKWNEPVKILFLGVLIKRKGVSDLLKAVERLKKNVDPKKFKVIIAGTGEEEERLKLECKKLNLEKNVEFVGWAAGEKKNKLLRNSQILVLPSYNEGLPIAILEAMSYGMPIVTCDVGDISSAVHDGENGFLLQPGDVVKMSKSLEKLVGDEKVYTIMAEKSRQIAVEEFNDLNYFEKIRKTYLRCSTGGTE